MNWPWLLDNPRRLWGLAFGAVVAGLVICVVVLFVRVNGIANGASPAPGLTTTPDERLATPGPLATTAPDGDLASVSPDLQVTADPNGDAAFADAGDPTPIALQAVRAWLEHRYGALEGLLMPGVLDEVTANAPPSGAAVSGEAVLTSPGPTEAVVRVPTNKGDLDVSLIVVNRKDWMVEALGWVTK